jgi:hypothetical protein
MIKTETKKVIKEGTYTYPWACGSVDVKPFMTYGVELSIEHQTFGSTDLRKFIYDLTEVAEVLEENNR